MRAPTGPRGRVNTPPIRGHLIGQRAGTGFRPFLPRIALLIAASTIAAGCLSNAEPPADPAPDTSIGGGIDYAEALFLKHDHLDPAEHLDFSMNVTPLAYRQISPPGTAPGAHGLDIHGNLLFVKTNNGFAGFSIYDISEPANPVLVGQYEDASTTSGDRTIEVSGDGKTVFLGSEGSRPGVHAIDISDPANPTFVDWFEIPRFGAHTIFAHETGDGRQLVFAVSVGVQILEYRETGTPLGMKLVPVSRYQTASDQLAKIPGSLVGDGTTYAIRDLYGHDIFVEDDPVTGQTLLYVAFAYEGLRIVDVSSPETPREIASWVPGGEGNPWYVHTVVTTHIDDRRIIIIGSEVFENRHLELPSPVWIVDGTNLANPVELATWTNPADVGSQNILMSAHDFRVEGTTLHLTHYHAGYWALDIADPANPEIIAFHLPAVDPGVRPDNPRADLDMAGIPLSIDVVARNGIAYVADLHTGLHVLQVDPLVAEYGASRDAAGSGEAPEA